MDASYIITYGLGGVAVFGILTVVIQKIAGSSDIKSAIDSFKKGEKQKKLEESIEKFSKEERVILRQLKVSEYASAEAKTKIQEIVRKAAVEVQGVLKKDTIKEIDDEIEEDWSKL